MIKTIKELFQYVLDTELHTSDIELDQYRIYLRMKSNYDKGFHPIYIMKNPYFYYQSINAKTGKIYESNQGYRMLKYSLKYNTNKSK